MKMKSESEVAQSCPTPRDPVDCSLPGSSVHGFSRQEYWSGVPLLFPVVNLAVDKWLKHFNVLYLINPTAVLFYINNSYSPDTL